MALKKVYKKILAVIILLICTHCVNAQCIASFPYLQDFESTDGGWVTGGILSDWGYGIPRKPIIDRAASGSKCWMIGDPQSSNYNGGQASWLQSPCFDFTNLQYPVIDFKAWWESERNFDGTGMQYSIDNGASWSDVGSVSEPRDCFYVNWYNTPSVRYLTLMQSGSGWSGSSGGWLASKKALPALAGKSNVIFRFVFGAGTINNNFDGFALDDFSISNAPPNSADFTSSCSGINTADFTNTSALCPTTFSWDFGDPASGTSNTSTLKNPSHTFSSSGTYNITLTVSSANNAPSTIMQQVSIIALTSTITTPIKCGGDNNGAITVDVVGGTGPYTYTWNTTPVQTNATATNLTAGNYTVTVSGSNACATSLTINLTEPPALGHKVAYLNPGCVFEKGSISIAETGGTGPYTYTWSPNVSNTFSASGLTSGRYDITVMDKFSCTDFISIDLIDIFPPAASISDKTDVSCNGGNNGTATVSVTGGTAPVEYSWNTSPVQTTTTAGGLKAGSYNFTAKDANGCIGKTSVTITEPPPTTVSVITKDATCNLANASINLLPSGGVGNYEYNWSPIVSTSSSATNIRAGRYAVALKDNAGCVTNVSDIYIANFGTPTKIFLGKDTTICTGERIDLSAPTTGNYLWQNNSTQQSYTITQTGKYWLRYTNSNNCISSDTIQVNVVPNCVDIYFPSIFSPNNDGMNDQFGPVGNLNAVSNYKLSVYNRWGQLVFTTENPRQRWSGEKGTQISATSTYVWYASYNFRGSGDKYKKGTLIITR